MKNERTQKITSFIFAKLFYVVLGLLAASSVIAYAAWSDAQTGGSGKLSESNWNALITQLQALPQSPSTPGSWTCQWFDGLSGASSVVSCGAGFRLITGGCATSPVQTGSITASNPAGSTTNGGWSCWATSGTSVMARAWCCK